jgi:hypothetical protein
MQLRGDSQEPKTVPLGVGLGPTHMRGQSRLVRATTGQLFLGVWVRLLTPGPGKQSHYQVMSSLRGQKRSLPGNELPPATCPRTVPGRTFVGRPGNSSRTQGHLGTRCVSSSTHTGSPGPCSKTLEQVISL